jgi:hypothetical protein
MTLASCRLLFVILLALAAAACQTEDKAPQPRFVSNARDGGIAVAAPSAHMARGEAFAAESSQGNRYFIEFRSRYALSYGHSYVIFGRTNQSGAMINPEVAGLAPASESKVPYVLGHFVPVPAETGWSDGDLEEKYRSASWRVMLTEAEYRQVVADIRKLQTRSTTWNATFYNCNAFVASIARSMGYKAPSHWLRPQQFITRLREMNAG